MDPISPEEESEQSLPPSMPFPTPEDPTPFWMLMVKESIAKELMATWPGVTGIDVGYKKVGGELTEEFAIRVYVSEKREDVPDEERIPPYIGGFKTDILQINPVTTYDTTTYRPLRGGIFIGTHTGPGPGHGAGTAGCVVYDVWDSTPCLLSNYHVLFAGIGVGDDVSQPPEDVGGTYPQHVIGKVVRGVVSEYVDAAICSIGDNTIVNDVLGVGPVATYVGNSYYSLLQTGQRVKRRGAASGPIIGIVDSITATVNVSSDAYPGGSQVFTNQISIHPVGAANFNIPGDSGSVVFGEGNPNEFTYPGGLAFAGDLGGSGNGFANQLYYVFRELQIRTSYNEPPNSSFAYPILRGFSGNGIVTEKAFDPANRGRTGVLIAGSAAYGGSPPQEGSGDWTYYYIDQSNELRAVVIYVTNTANYTVQNPDKTLPLHFFHFQNPEWVGINAKSLVWSEDNIGTGYIGNSILGVNANTSPRFHFFSGSLLSSENQPDGSGGFYTGSHITDEAIGDEEIAAISPAVDHQYPPVNIRRIVAFRSATQPASYRSLGHITNSFSTGTVRHLSSTVVTGSNNVGDTYASSFIGFDLYNSPGVLFYQEAAANGSSDPNYDYLNSVFWTDFDPVNPGMSIGDSYPVPIGQPSSDYGTSDSARTAASVAPTRIHIGGGYGAITYGDKDIRYFQIFHESILYQMTISRSKTNPNDPFSIEVRLANNQWNLKTSNSIKFVSSEILPHYFTYHNNYFIHFNTYWGGSLYTGWDAGPYPTGVFWVDTATDTAFFTNIENGDKTQKPPILTLPGAGTGFSGRGMASLNTTRYDFDLNGYGWAYENSLLTSMNHADGTVSFYLVTLRETPLVKDLTQPALRLTSRTDDSNTGGTPRLTAFMDSKQQSSRIEGSYW